jgi:hypothetical protein
MNNSILQLCAAHLQETGDKAAAAALALPDTMRAYQPTAPRPATARDRAATHTPSSVASLVRPHCRRMVRRAHSSATKLNGRGFVSDHRYSDSAILPREPGAPRFGTKQPGRAALAPVRDFFNRHYPALDGYIHRSKSAALP